LSQHRTWLRNLVDCDPFLYTTTLEGCVEIELVTEYVRAIDFNLLAPELFF